MSKRFVISSLTVTLMTILSVGCGDETTAPDTQQVDTANYGTHFDADRAGDANQLARFFPLQKGNFWVYEIFQSEEEDAPVGGETVTVRVTGSGWFEGRPTFRMSNYLFPISDGSIEFQNVAPGQTREHSNGESGTWYPWSSFGLSEIPISLPEFESDCVHGSNGTYLGTDTVTVPAGTFEGAARIIYTDLPCSDLGISREVLAPGVGLIERSSSSLAGETTWKLIYAEVGGRIFDGDAATIRDE